MGMTVEELIKKLEAMPKKSKVVFYGADNHYYDIKNAVDDEDGDVVLTESLTYDR